jgi:hypothetical protein
MHSFPPFKREEFSSRKGHFRKSKCPRARESGHYYEFEEGNEEN